MLKGSFLNRATPEGSSGPYHSHYFIKLLAHFLFLSAMPLSIFAIFSAMTIVCCEQHLLMFQSLVLS